jgi:hypothetical protein
LSEETYKKITKDLIEDVENFQDAINEDFSSRAGFVSFYSTDFVDWLDYLKVKEEKKLAVVFQYILGYFLNQFEYGERSLYESNDVYNEINTIDYELIEQ